MPALRKRLGHGRSADTASQSADRVGVSSVSLSWLGEPVAGAPLSGGGIPTSLEHATTYIFVTFFLHPSYILSDRTLLQTNVVNRQDGY
jgi:hypothetical protein